MTTRLAVALAVLALVAASCTGSAAPTTMASTTTTTLAPTTTTTAATTTTVPPTTTSSTTTTTTTVPPTTTSTTEAPEESTTTTTTRVAATTTSTTEPPENADPDLIPFAGLWRQPTMFNVFLQLEATGELFTGSSPESLPLTGAWDIVDDELVISGLDLGIDGCGNAVGRYDIEEPRSGGIRVLLIEDECVNRVNYLTQPGSTCQCFLYLRVDAPEE